MKNKYPKTMRWASWTVFALTVTMFLSLKERESITWTVLTGISLIVLTVLLTFTIITLLSERKQIKKIVLFLILGLVIFVCLVFAGYKLGQKQAPSSPLLTPTPAIEGEFCGGIAGIECPKSYKCQLEGNYPDASGKCVKE